MDDGMAINCPGCGESLIEIPRGTAFGDPSTYRRVNQLLHDAGALVVNETNDVGCTSVQSYHSTRCRNLFIAQSTGTGGMGIYEDDDDGW